MVILEGMGWASEKKLGGVVDSGLSLLGLSCGGVFRSAGAGPKLWQYACLCARQIERVFVEGRRGPPNTPLCLKERRVVATASDFRTLRSGR